MKRSKHEFAILRWLCAAAILVTLPAQAQQRSVLTRHVREAVVNGGAPFLGLLPDTQRLRLAITLPLRNQASLDELLQELYDPQSLSYRRYLTVQEFADRFGPGREEYEAVVHFMEANGMVVTGTAPNRLVVDVTASVADIDRVFHVTMGLYQHPTENHRFYAPDREPSVDLNVPLWHVGGLDNYSLPRPLYRKGAIGSAVHSNTTGSGPGGSFLGSDRRAAYYGGTSLTGSRQSVGLFELDGYSLGDVQAYFRNVGQPLNVPVNNVLLLGASGASDGDDTEQVIDIIDAISMAPGMSQVLVYIVPRGSFSSGTGDTDIFNRMATDNIAKQLSVSWGWKPADPRSDDPIFQEFAAQGQSVFVASGDSGSYLSGDFVYPAEDAYVTAVGGTDLTTNGGGGSWASETGWSGSGGGPSPDRVAIPSYQQIAGVINTSNGGSSTLRNVPDVAAEANTDNYYCANGGCGEGLGGTSLAAPTWAGFLALVNQQNVASGKFTEGFLNPTIYQVGVGSSYHNYFHDITSGSNGAYTAVTGYDLVTGWGSPLASGWPLPVPTATANPTSITMSAPVNCTTGPDGPTLTNNGTGELVILNVTVSGSGFSLVENQIGTCNTMKLVGQGQSCDVLVTYTGVLGGSKGSIYIYDNASNSPQKVSLTGISHGICQQ